MSTLLVIFSAGAILGSALMAGTFFAFSTFVMRALARLPPAQGISAMQAINVVVQNRWFLGVFIGTAGVTGVCAALALADEFAKANWVVASAVAYIVGTFTVTIVRNVPLNNRLADVHATASEDVAVWHDYLRRWTYWNHVRTAAASVATLGFAYGAFGGPG